MASCAFSSAGVAAVAGFSQVRSLTQLQVIFDFLTLGHHRIKLLFPVLNGKSTLISCFSTNVNEIWRDDGGPREDLCTHKVLTYLVGKQLRKVDLAFRTDVWRLDKQQ